MALVEGGVTVVVEPSTSHDVPGMGQRMTGGGGGGGRGTTYKVDWGKDKEAGVDVEI